MKPKILFLADYPNWAFHNIYRSIKIRLEKDYEFYIDFSSVSNKALYNQKYDIIYSFFYGDKRYRRFDLTQCILIQEVASWRWKYDMNFGCLTAENFCTSYLYEANIVVCPSNELYTELVPHLGQRLFYMPNGVETLLFSPPKTRKGKLAIGWVGNPSDSQKNYDNIIVPLRKEYSNLIVADGRLSIIDLMRFYKKIDVLLITSKSESQPLPLLEALASGCFIISTKVGIVPEIITENTVGLIVNGDLESYRKAIMQVSEKIDLIREQMIKRVDLAKSEDWNVWVNRWKFLFESVLSNEDRLKLRVANRADLKLGQNPDITNTQFIKIITRVILDLLIFNNRFSKPSIVRRLLSRLKIVKT